MWGGRGERSVDRETGGGGSSAAGVGAEVNVKMLLGPAGWVGPVRMKSGHSCRLDTLRGWTQKNLIDDKQRLMKKRQGSDNQGQSKVQNFLNRRSGFEKLS